MGKRTLVPLLLLFLAASFVGCSAARKAYKQGNQEARQGNWDAAVVYYTRATREDPENIEFKMALRRALVEAAGEHLKEARKHLAAQEHEAAIEELQLATQLDASNKYAQDLLTQTRSQLREREAQREQATEFEQRRARARQLLQTQPILEPSSEAPINLKFAQDTSLRRIFEVLSQLSGINILFDESFRDKRVTIDLVDVSFREALDKLVMINRLFYKVVDPSTLIIIPDNAQKHRQYDDLVLHTFYVVNAEVNTVANMLRTIAGIQRVQPNPELKSITVRATPDQVAVAERIVTLNDKSTSEVILDIEILEVNRNKLVEFGLRLSEYELGTTYQPAGSTVDAGRTTVRLNRLAAGDTSDFFFTLPSSALYRLFKSTAEVEVLASPKLRAAEGQAAQLSIGQEVPIPVTSFVSQFGTPGGVPTTPVTSFQYRNVGINIQITPKVFVDGEIELELTLETSTQLETRTIAGIELPVFGTRQVANKVRLRDGETNLVGGLIQVQDRRSIAGLPGVSDVPLLGRIFSNNREQLEQQDVVFSITPHIVRAPLVSEEDMMSLPMGTEQQIKVPSAPPAPFTPPPAAEPPAAEPEGVPPEKPPAVEPEAVPPEEPPVPPEEAEPIPPAEPAEPREPSEPAEEVPPAVEPAAPAAPQAPVTPVPAPVSVLFSPPEPSAAVGSELELALIAGGAEGLSSGSLDLAFDPTELTVVRVEPGPFLTIDGKDVSFIPVIENGRVRIEFARRDDTLGLRGSGHIARVVVRVTAPGTAQLSASGTLRDAMDEPIPASFSAARIIGVQP